MKVLNGGTDSTSISSSWLFRRPSKPLDHSSRPIKPHIPATTLRIHASHKIPHTGLSLSQLVFFSRLDLCFVDACVPAAAAVISPLAVHGRCPVCSYGLCCTLTPECLPHCTINLVLFRLVGTIFGCRWSNNSKHMRRRVASCPQRALLPPEDPDGGPKVSRMAERFPQGVL